MNETIRCARCGGESPAEARFCIECGETLVTAATGSTVRLAGMPCANCGASNPEDANSCVMCGRVLAAAAAPRLQSFPAHPAPVPPPMRAAPLFPAHPAPVPPPMRRTPRHALPIGAIVFLGGLGMLLVLGKLWPGVLLLIGASMLAGESARGRIEQGLLSMMWWSGLTFLFVTNRFWPGILFLIGFYIFLSDRWRPHRRRP